MHTLSDIAACCFHGTGSGELITSPELTVNHLQAELHSSYSALLELGLQKLITLYPSVATLLIELVAGEDCVIFASRLSLTKDFTLTVQAVGTAVNPMSINQPTVLHWRLQINYGH